MGGRLLLHGGDGDEAADTELSLRTGGSSGGASAVPAAWPQTLRSPAPSPRSTLAVPQPLTIFYGGRICVCDVTEVQARSIIAAAQRGTTTTAAAAAEEGELAGVTAAAGREEEQAGAGSVVAAPEQHGPGLSMKASLQRFLQKRKSRAAAAAAGGRGSWSPYARPGDHLRPRYEQCPPQQLQASFFL